jgi:TolB-like protein
MKPLDRPPMPVSQQSPEEVRLALKKMLSSEAFGKAERPARFLRHLVEAALQGEGHLLKESVLGTEVFGREASWDPRLDPVVRQEAARLRKRIARYYELDNPDADLRIEVPVGSYAPVFRTVPRSATSDVVAGQSETALIPPAVRVPKRRILWFWISTAAALVLCAGGVLTWRMRVSTAENTRSIAVLPFVNLSGSAADSYFGDGLTDEITDGLTQVKSLKVVARSSAFQFRGKSADGIGDIHEIGRQLKVAYVLEGSVERFENRVKIRARLERVSDRNQVWSKTYERQTGDLFAVQSELASAIAASLQASVGGSTRRKHEVGGEAHDLYMQGRYELEQMTPQSMARAQETLKRAIDRDPAYAAAYCALGLAKWNQTLASDSQEADAARKESATLFRKALELDPELSDAHAGLANYAMQYDWDWARAEKELRAGLAGDPSVAVENSYAFLLVFRNRFAEAEEHIRRSQELDPVGSVSVANRGLMWNLEGRFEKSREEFERMLRRSPRPIPAQYITALTYIEEGHPELAMPMIRELKERAPAAQMFEAMAAARAGNKSEALSLIRPFEEKYPDTGAAIQWFALVYAFLGDETNTVKWLERSADRREWQALNLAVHPAYAAIRNSARFRALKKKMGLE